MKIMFNALLLLCGTVVMAPVDVMAANLTAADIRQKIIGNTAVGKGWEEFYRPDGTLAGRQAGEMGIYHGEWRLSGDKLCFHYPKASKYDGCWTVSPDGDQLIFLKENGSSAPATLKAGNPDDL